MKTAESAMDNKVVMGVGAVVVAIVLYAVYEHYHKKGYGGVLPPVAPPVARPVTNAVPTPAQNAKITAGPANGPISTMQGISASMYPLKTPCGTEDWTIYAPTDASTLNYLIAGFQAGVDTIGPARKYRYRGLIQPPVADRTGFYPPWNDSGHGICESAYWPSDVLP